MAGSERFPIEELRDPKTGELVSTTARYGSGPSARLLGYYGYDPATPLECPACGWSGAGKDASQEMHQELFDVSCPRCDQMLLVVSFPTIEETRQAAAAGHPGAIDELSNAERAERRTQRAAELELRADTPLPELPGARLQFVWDFEEADGECWTLIRCGEETVWRELAYYEGWQRFNEVKQLLKQRYEQFVSLTPTDRSELYLFGDDVAGPGKIERS
jgi:hypothetical protein